MHRDGVMKSYRKACNLAAGALAMTLCTSVCAQTPNPLLSGQEMGSAVSGVSDRAERLPADVSAAEPEAPEVASAAASEAPADAVSSEMSLRARVHMLSRNIRVLNGMWGSDASYEGDVEGRRSLAGALGLEYLGGTEETVRLSGDLSGIEAVLSPEDRDFLIVQWVMRQKLGEAGRVSSGDGIFWDFTDALFDIDVDQRARLGLYSELLPDLIRVASEAGDDVRARKFRMQRDTMAYHWGKLSAGVKCGWEGSDVSFVFSLNDIGRSGTFEAGVERGGTDIGASVSCGLSVQEGAAFADASAVQDALGDSLRSLRAKDADASSEDLLRLTRALEGLYGRYGKPGPLNADWEGAPLETWLAELDVIRLMLVEQTRFATNARVERVVQKIWPDAGFYYRLCRFDASRRVLKGAFGAEAERLWSANGSAYRWVADHMEPKKLKKLDKAFAAWTKTKSKKKDVMLPRKLLGAWAMWSLGDYARAASYAGNVAEGKSRLVHPQLHSFDVMLRAIRGEDISEEALGTYIRVISLKVPSLAFETLAEAGAWMRPAMRSRVVEQMRVQNPSLAPDAAVEFYRQYEAELRQSWDSAHCMRVDAWLERMLRPTESALSANRRRLSYLGELVGAGDIGGVSSLAMRVLRERRLMLPQWVAFWENVQAQAASGTLETLGKCLPDVQKLTFLELSEVNACFERGD